jgi:hypothetical protein
MALEQIHGNKKQIRYTENGKFLHSEKFVLGLQKVCNASGFICVSVNIRLG